MAKHGEHNRFLLSDIFFYNIPTCVAVNIATLFYLEMIVAFIAAVS